nr:hypothetical protein [Chenggangzhangella methanolivorans]
MKDHRLRHGGRVEIDIGTARRDLRFVDRSKLHLVLDDVSKLRALPLVGAQLGMHARHGLDAAAKALDKIMRLGAMAQSLRCDRLHGRKHVLHAVAEFAGEHPLELFGLSQRLALAVELLFALPQRLVGDGALEKVGGLTGKDVEQAKVAVGRLVRVAPMRRNHPEQGAATRQQRRRLGGADVGAPERVEFLRSDDLVPLFVVGDDGPPAGPERHRAAAERRRAHPLPETLRFGRQIAGAQKLQMTGATGVVVRQAQELHRAELRLRDRDRGVDNLAVELGAVLLADQLHANGVQQLDV